MKKKLIFFDIDGTLYSEGKVLPSTLETIKELKKQGHYIVIATGRSKGQCNDILSKIKPDGIIANNGKYAELYSEVLFEDKIKVETMEQLFNDFNSKDNAYSFSSLEGYMTTLSDNELIKEFTDYFNIDYPTVVSKEYYRKKPIFSLGIYHRNDVSSLVEKYKELTFMPVNALGYDVVNKGGEKGQPIPFFLKKLNIDFLDTIAVGDNTNDISLLDSVYDSICMGQGHPLLKEHAKYVTLEVNKGGIKHAFKNILKLT